MYGETQARNYVEQEKQVKTVLTWRIRLIAIGSTRWNGCAAQDVHPGAWSSLPLSWIIV